MLSKIKEKIKEKKMKKCENHCKSTHTHTHTRIFGYKKYIYSNYCSSSYTCNSNRNIL